MDQVGKTVQAQTNMLGVRLAKGYEVPDHIQLRGKFVGHILPGLIFIVWGAEWLFFYLRSRSRKQPLRKPVAVFCKAELIIKLVTPVVGILAEMSSAHWTHMFYEERGELTQGGDNVETNINNYFHASMHMGFLLAGVVDLLEKYWKALPQRSGLLALSLAFSLEGLLFGYHADMHEEVMKNHVESLAHKLLLIPIYASAVILLCEFVVGLLVVYRQKSKHSVQEPNKGIKSSLEWLLLVRALSAILQGSWMFHMPFMPENLFSNPMASMMATTIYFGWHLLGCAVVWIICAVAHWKFSMGQTEGRAFEYDLANSTESKSVGTRVDRISTVL